MPMPEHLKTKNIADVEEWFYGALEQEPLPAAHLMAVISSTARDGNEARLDEWAELLHEALVEAGDKNNGLQLLRLRCSWHHADPAFRSVCEKAAGEILSDRTGKILVGSSGFSDHKLSVVECLRRLDTLMRLKPGILCHDKTWGFGIVKRMDDFYKKVTINFTSKQGHQMSLAYAAETLDLIRDDHILARKHNDPEELAQLIADDPAEVVRIALRSYGPMSAPILKERLVPDIFPEADWKSFWDGARKGLKNDPFVDIPTKRSEPIRLLKSGEKYGEAWFEALKGERDMKRILELVGELEKARTISELPEPHRVIVAGRLAFVAWGGEGRQHELVARAVIITSRHAQEEGGPDVPRLTAMLLEPPAFVRAVKGVPAREIEPLLAHLRSHDGDTLSSISLSLLNKLPYNVLNAVISDLRAHDQEEPCFAILREELTAGTASVHVLYWACRNIDDVIGAQLVGANELFWLTIDALGEKMTADKLKTQNQLRTLVEEKPECVDQLLQLCDATQRAALVKKVDACRGWEASGRRSVMARMVRSYPELEQVLSGTVSEEDAATRRQGRFTSLRSHRAKRLQLQKLMQKDIPENSREIAVARSYGDLRENAEYKYAKEHQSVLMRRKAELEHDLAEVMATDFSGFPTDVVGMGTYVTIEKSDGTQQSYAVLGEWDRDEDADVIGCRSKLAEVLSGHKEGDSVSIPGVIEDETCRIVSVAGLPESIRAWLVDTDS